MLGSMFVGLLVGFFSRYSDQSWRANGMFWKNVSRMDWCLYRHLLFGTWGPIIAGTAIIPAVLGSMIVLAIFWRRGS